MDSVESISRSLGNDKDMNANYDKVTDTSPYFNQVLGKIQGFSYVF